MTASLEPPSLRRRGDGPDGPRDPGGPGEPGDSGGDPREPRARRSRLTVVVMTVVALLLAGLVAAIVFWFATLSGNGGRHEDARVPPTQPPAAQLPPAEYDAVTTAARSALRMWARPQVRYPAWWKALTPLLSPSARSDYAGTDPAQLPPLTLRRAADVEPGPSADTATVFVDTTSGRFGVDLTRQDADAPWLASRFLFPGEESSL